MDPPISASPVQRLQMRATIGFFKMSSGLWIQVFMLMQQAL